MEKTDYKIIPLIKRMLAVAAKEDKKQFFRVACLTIFAGVDPFMSVVLPKRKNSLWKALLMQKATLKI